MTVGGFHRVHTSPATRVRPPQEEPAPAPRQLSMALDSVKLRGMSPLQRSAALALLARLLMEAAGVAVAETDADQL